MTKIKLYLNENIQTAVVEALRKRGIDTISTMEANRKAFSDEEQLKFAKKEGRTILTYNLPDYVKLHTKWCNEKLEHCGIVVSEQLPVGEFLR